MTDFVDAKSNRYLLWRWRNVTRTLIESGRGLGKITLPYLTLPYFTVPYMYLINTIAKTRNPKVR